MLTQRASFSRFVIDELGFDGVLLTENNPARSGYLDNMTGKTIYDAFDLLPKDLLSYMTKGIDGLILDLPPAQSVIYCLKNKKYDNIEWAKKSYPNQEQSIEKFIELCAPYTKWLHFSDKHDENHSGDHLGPCAFIEGKLTNFETSIMNNSQIFDLIKKYCTEKIIPMTIETKDAHLN
jgi:hypothetical protein